MKTGMLIGQVLLASLSTTLLSAQMALSVSPSAASPAPLGTVVTFTASVANADPGTLWCRFRAHRTGDPLSMIKDFGPDAALDWTASEHEGDYEIEVSASNRDTGETVTVITPFRMTSRVSGQAVVNPTAHPLVFLFSAPACTVGSTMRVTFQSADGVRQQTTAKPCAQGLSMNFYLGGLKSNTAYTARSAVETPAASGQIATQTGAPVSFTPQADVSWLTAETVITPPVTPVSDGILLQATLFTHTLATDLYGEPVWYYPGNVSFLTRAEPGGRFFGIVEDPSGDQSAQIVREFDLTGMTTLETNAARVNEQLAALGVRRISGFHHEARRLSNGNFAVLAGVEQILTDVQGPGPVDILGDMILVLDRDLNVVWVWDAFDHLDVTRMATMNDICGGGNCPPTFLDPAPNDWLHGNALQETPDGNLLYSARSQDWLIKIDYSGGDGTGNVIWRLGKDGDFEMRSTDPWPWFSHQHDGQFLRGASSSLLVFDDGNLRRQSDPSANSRGQVIDLDEQNLVATLRLNADLGAYAFALGAAQVLSNGNYSFDVGFLEDGTSMTVEVNPAGQVVYGLHAAAPEYRSFRMQDLYTPNE